MKYLLCRIAGLSLFFLVPHTLMFFGLAHTAYADTMIQDDITQDTVWSPLGSPYVISNDISISPGITLTVMPGTIVKSDNSTIRVFGIFDGEGSRDSKIYFTSLADDTAGGDTGGDGSDTEPTSDDQWGIQFMQNSSSTIAHAVIRYAGAGMFFLSSHATFDDVDLASGGPLEMNQSSLGIQDSHFKTMPDDGVLEYNGSSLHVSSSTFDSVSGTAVLTYGSSHVAFQDVSIHDSGRALAIYNSSGGTCVRCAFSGIDGDSVDVYNSSSLSITDSHMQGASGNSLITLYDFSSAHPSLLSATSDIFEGGMDGIVAYGTAQANVDRTAFSSFDEAGILAFQEPLLTVMNSKFTSNADGVLAFGDVQGFIATSTFQGNGNLGIDATLMNASLNAKNDWWGDPSGPHHLTLNPDGKGDSISDNVDFRPWLPGDPLKEKPPCCSNIAFMPGIEASRLYSDGMRVWEPGLASGVFGTIKKLHLDASGRSLNPITTKDVIDGGIGYDVYGDFMKYLDGLAAARTIQSWEPFPYDWRFDAGDIVGTKVQLTGGSSYDMISRLEQLASTSITGKVTIIAHSNGGLVTKALIKNLSDHGRQDLISKIDKVIFVAVPQLGTPVTVPGLLHGHDLAIGGGWALSEGAGREFSRNMLGAYGLIPSKTYFSKVSDPVISFDSTIPASFGFGSYGNAIRDYDTLESFMAGEKDRRPQPALNDTADPIKLSRSLLDEEKSTHDTLDYFEIPPTISTYQIAGWGVKTVKGFSYSAHSPCPFKLLCLETDTLVGNPVMTDDGDGTVVVPSAAYSTSTTYYVNLNASNRGSKANRSHSTILEISALQDLVTSILTSRPPAETTTISRTKPASGSKSIALGVYSPVAIDAYDAAGNHTGVVESTTTPSDPDIQFIEQNIPNSYYMQLGEGKFMGFDGAEPSRIVLQGTGIGTFTFDMSAFDGDVKTGQDIFADIPVTPTMTAVLEDSASTSAPTLALDEDGDGTIDAVMKPNQEFDPKLYLDVVRKAVLVMHLAKKTEQEFLKKIDKMLELADKDKYKQLGSRIRKLIKNMDFKKNYRRMSDQEKQNFINILSGILDNLSS